MARGANLTRVQLRPFDPVIERNEEVLCGRNAESHGLERTDLIVAGGDVVAIASGQESSQGFMHGDDGFDIDAGDASFGKSGVACGLETEPGRATARVASSMTRVSKPSCLPSMAEKADAAVIGQAAEEEAL